MPLAFQREQYWSQRPSVTDQADHEAFDSQGAVDHDGRIVWVLRKTKDTGVELFLQWNGMIEKAIDSGTFCLTTKQSMTYGKFWSFKLAEY